MIEQEKVIKVFITTDDVSKEKGDCRYIVNGLENLSYIIDCLNFNGNDSIYVHLNSPVSREEMSKKLIMFCKLLKDKGLVYSAIFCRMGLPSEGDGKYNTTIGENNMLTNERYMINFTNKFI